MQPDPNSPDIPETPAVPDFIPDAILALHERNARETVEFDDIAADLGSLTSPVTAMMTRLGSLAEGSLSAALVTGVVAGLAPIMWLTVDPYNVWLFLTLAIVTSVAAFGFAVSTGLLLYRHRGRFVWIITEMGTPRTDPDDRS